MHVKTRFKDYQLNQDIVEPLVESLVAHSMVTLGGIVILPLK